MCKKIFKDKISLIVFGVIILALILRLYKLGWPDWQVFDEIYYYNFGHDYLVGNYFFDVHPPLGKLFISLGLTIFNNSIFGARFFQVIAGVVSLYFIYRLSFELFKNKTIALFALILLFLETSFFIESRYALINIFIVVFTLPAYIYFWRYRETPKDAYLYYSLLFVSLATCVKWTGAATYLVFVIFILLDKKIRENFINTFSNNIFIKVILCSTMIIVPYVVLFIPDMLKGETFTNWHLQALNFHKNLVGNHPYASRWYKWIIDARPIWIEFKQTPNSDVIGIVEVGNIVILWTAIVAFIANIINVIKKKNFPLLLILLTIVVNIIPWILIKRESFYYHFIPIIPFVIISCAYFLAYLYKNKYLKMLVVLIFILAACFFIWFLPLLIGEKISFTGYDQRVIFDSWR